MTDDTRLIPVSGPQAAEIQDHADESVAALPNDEIRRRYQQAVTLLRSLADSYEDGISEIDVLEGADIIESYAQELGYTVAPAAELLRAAFHSGEKR